jgi:hypothetical protein
MRGGIQGQAEGLSRPVTARAWSAIVPVTITIRKEYDFLRVIYRGEENLESEMGLEAALLKAIKEHDCHKLLHDCRAVTGSRLGTLDCFTVAGSYDRRFLPIRSALLDHAEHYRENRFWETTVRNQGFTTKVFDDEKEAVVWLLDEDEQCREQI